MKKYVTTFLVISIGICLIIILNQNKKIISIKESIKPITDSVYLLNKENDSLKSEMFVKDINLGRFEHVLDRAEAEMSPECKEELETILSQTE